MKSQSKAIKISKRLKYHAELLEHNLRSSFPWGLTRLTCDTCLGGLWEYLKEIDKLLPADSQPENKIAKLEGSLEQLAHEVCIKASWLYTNFHSPEYTNWQVALVIGRTTYKVLLARLTEFQELYDKTVEEKRHEVVENSSFANLIDLPDEIKEWVKQVKAKYNIAK